MPHNIGPSDLPARAVHTQHTQEASEHQQQLCRPTSAKGVVQQGWKGHDRQEGAGKKHEHVLVSAHETVLPGQGHERSQQDEARQCVGFIKMQYEIQQSVC